MHQVSHLVTIFAQTFQTSHQTVLVPGADEPLYLPAQNGQALHQIFSRADYFASALHEIAHWCVAGPARRQQEDYGYWYAPDGRTAEQQRLFMQVEIYPQALEACFAQACQYPFRVSIDNLSGHIAATDIAAFSQAVQDKQQQLLRRGLPARAQAFYLACQRFYHRNKPCVSYP